MTDWVVIISGGHRFTYDAWRWKCVVEGWHRLAAEREGWWLR